MAKKKQIETPSEIKPSSFLGRKLVDIYNEKEEVNELTLEFDNGHKIILSGKISLKIERL